MRAITTTTIPLSYVNGKWARRDATIERNHAVRRITLLVPRSSSRNAKTVRIELDLDQLVAAVVTLQRAQA
jgi:hypothetical protein